MSNEEKSKKAMKKVLKDCIKSLSNISSDAEINVVIIQFKPNENRYDVDFHINDASQEESE